MPAEDAAAAVGTPEQTPPAKLTPAEQLLAEADFDFSEEAPASTSAETTTQEPPVTETPAETPAPTSPTHAPRLLARARALDLDDAALALPSEQLDDLVYHLEQRELKRARQTPAQRQAEPPPPPEPEPEPLFTAEEEAEVHPALAAKMKKLAAQVAAAEKLAKQTTQSAEERAHAERVARIDGFFLKHPEIFGTMPIGELPPDSELALKRNAAWEAMTRLPSGTIEQRGEQVLKILFGKAPKDPAVEKALADRREKWNGAGAAQPTQRNPRPEKKGIALAKKTFEQGMKDREAEAAVVEDDEDPFAE